MLRKTTKATYSDFDKTVSTWFEEVGSDDDDNDASAEDVDITKVVSEYEDEGSIGEEDFEDAKVLIMSEVRFNFLLICLRFDQKENRNRSDRFSPLRTVWKKLIRNCTAILPHCYVSIDEQLLEFRGKCPFRA
ncbi:hypothetical protein ILUMI_15572 [Ignelater luminosus]|uniref:PiggyBac transposable element-derived protein domain-containing protein n=1 Tax=Ignelater luminosus TaxID=2038154 RepID=A0A8K0CS00_IGNLU|nr:hypothetical protein ILUMI_15572 [Ignelater luminosus]